MAVDGDISFRRRSVPLLLLFGPAVQITNSPVNQKNASILSIDKRM